MSQLFFRIFPNSKEIGSNASGGTDLLPRARLCKQEYKFPWCPLCRLPAEGMAQIIGGSSHLKRYGLELQMIFFKKKNFSKVYAPAWVYKHRGTLFTLVCVCGTCSLQNRYQIPWNWNHSCLWAVHCHYWELNSGSLQAKYFSNRAELALQHKGVANQATLI